MSENVFCSSHLLHMFVSIIENASIYANNVWCGLALFLIISADDKTDDICFDWRFKG